MAGRSKIHKDEVSLSKALEVFWKYGYEGSSMQLLLEAMDLNKGSLYHAFGSKRELFVRVVERYSQEQLAYLEKQLSMADNVIWAIQRVFIDMVQDDDRHKINRGCLLVNTLGELSFQYPSLRDLVAHKLRLMEETFLKFLNIAKQKGIISKEVPTEDIAKHLITLWSGTMVNRRLYPEKNGLEAIVKVNMQVLDQYLNKSYAKL